MSPTAGKVDPGASCQRSRPRLKCRKKSGLRHREVQNGTRLLSAGHRPPADARSAPHRAQHRRRRAQGKRPGFLAIVIEEPISSKGKRVSHELHEFYVKFNDLSEIEPNRFNRALIAKVGGTPLYKNLYDRKFDAYISDYMDAHKKLVGLLLEMARKDGYNPGGDGASVSIHRPHHFAPDVRTHGLFINCANEAVPVSILPLPQRNDRENSGRDGAAGLA